MMSNPSLAFDQIGAQGRVFVLVHGWCCRRAYMADLGRELAGSFRIFSVDLPGHGESPRSASPEFSAMTEALVGFLDEHDLRDVVLVGHSMGGVLSLMAAGHSSRVTAVVNLDGSFPLTTRASAAYADLFLTIQQQGYRTTMEGILGPRYFLPHEDGSVATKIVAEMLATPEDWAFSLLRQFPHLDASATLPKLRIPMLFIGSDKPGFDEAVAKSLNPGIEVTRLAGCGHFLPVFATDRVAALIRNFL